MDLRQVLRLIAFSIIAAMGSGIALAQAWPAKPIVLIVGGGAGSNLDVMVRPIAERLAIALGQPVIVDNKPGAGGILAMTTLAKSAPDGHTIALATMAQAVFNPYMFSKLPYDPQRDLEPVAPLVASAMVLAAHPSLPANTLPEFVALAKAKPGHYFIATPSLGAPPHIFAMLLVRAAGIDVTLVPHKSGTEAMTAAISGGVPLVVDGPVGLAPLIGAGKLKAIAVLGRERDPVLPQVPTARESGVDAQGEAWIGIVAPAGTPAPVVQRLNRELSLIMKSADMRGQNAGRGFRTLVATPEEFRATIREDHAKWSALIKAADLKLD